MLLGVFLLMGIAASAQLSESEERQLDSLNQIIENASNDTVKVRNFLEVSYVLYRLNVDTLFYYGQITVDLSKKNLQRENISAREVEVYRRHIAGAYNNMGYARKYKGAISEAIDYYTKSLNIYDQVDNLQGKASCVNNLGVVHKMQGDLEKSLEYYERSLGYNKELGDTDGMAGNLSNMALVYAQKGDYEKALEYSFLSLKYDQDNKNHYGIANAYINIGTTYQDMKELDEAKNYYLKSIKMAEERSYKKLIAVASENLGQVYFFHGDMDECQRVAEKAHELALELEYPQVTQNTSQLLSKVYRAQNKYKAALEMSDLHFLMRDSLRNAETEKATLRQSMSYEYEKEKALQAAEYDASMALADEAKKRQQLVTVAIGIGLALALVFAIFVVNRLRVTRRQKHTILEQKKQVDEAFLQLDEKSAVIEEKQNEIIDSINYAQRIQKALFTSDGYWDKIAEDRFILLKPKDIVSGDFYWAYHHEATNTSLWTVADCTGHGVPGAFMSMLGISFLDEIVVENDVLQPDEILNELRAKIVKALEQNGMGEQKDGMDMGLCAWNKDTNMLSFAGANNSLYLLRDGVLNDVKADKQPVGQWAHEKPFKTNEIQLQKGDNLYLFTDGYADQFGGEKGKKLKTKPFKNLLISMQARSMEQQCELIDNAFIKWKGNLEQIDDVCIIGVRVTK